MPPPPKRSAERPTAFVLKSNSAWLLCSVCRGQMSIAHGYIASAMTNKKAIELGVASGWIMSPQIKCRFCRGQITDQEIQDLRAMFKRVEDGGNDGADVYDAQAMIHELEKKYGKLAMREFMT